MSNNTEEMHAFHHRHGDGITLSGGNTVATRNGGIGAWRTVFSCDPLEVSETFTVELTDTNDQVGNDISYGLIKNGFTMYAFKCLPLVHQNQTCLVEGML